MVFPYSLSIRPTTRFRADADAPLIAGLAGAFLAKVRAVVWITSIAKSADFTPALVAGEQVCVGIIFMDLLST
jgi:hypothetical protein